MEGVVTSSIKTDRSNIGETHMYINTGFIEIENETVIRIDSVTEEQIKRAFIYKSVSN